MVEVLRRHGLPVTPGEIGFTDEEFVQAVEFAPEDPPRALHDPGAPRPVHRPDQGRIRRLCHKPSVAELRPVVHPEGVKDRRSGEHWAGRIYMREISLAHRPAPGEHAGHAQPADLPDDRLRRPRRPGPAGAGDRGRRPRRADGPAVPAARLRRRRGRPLEEAVLARRRVPGPGRRLPVRRRGAGRLRPARRRPVGLRPDRLAVGVPRHARRPRRHPDQGRDRPRRCRPSPERAAAGRGGGVRAALVRYGAGPQGRRGAEVPPARPRHRGVPADPGPGGPGHDQGRPVLLAVSASPCSRASRSSRRCSTSCPSSPPAGSSDGGVPSCGSVRLS